MHTVESIKKGIEDQRMKSLRPRYKGYDSKAGRFKVDDVNYILHLFERDADSGFWKDLGVLTDDIASKLSP